MGLVLSSAREEMGVDVPGDAVMSASAIEVAIVCINGGMRRSQRECFEI